MAQVQDNTEASAAALSWGELTKSQQQTKLGRARHFLLGDIYHFEFKYNETWL